MMAQGEGREAMLEDARALIRGLEQDDGNEVQRMLDRLASHRESMLYQDLGRLTRDLHDALNNIHIDSELADLAEKEMPNCRERLNYVIDMTDQAAHRTLNAVEEILPLSKQIADDSGALLKAWSRFVARQMAPDEFRALSRQIAEFLGMVVDSSTRVHARLSDVLVAQDFQDITGQVIRQVIAPVQEVETRLVGLVRKNGARLGPKNGHDSDAAALEGPQIPGREVSTAVRGQDEVDDLLSSLGF